MALDLICQFPLLFWNWLKKLQAQQIIKKYAIGIFVDLKKAFDTADHDNDISMAYVV